MQAQKDDEHKACKRLPPLHTLLDDYNSGSDNDGPGDTGGYGILEKPVSDHVNCFRDLWAWPKYYRQKLQEYHGAQSTPKLRRFLRKGSYTTSYSGVDAPGVALESVRDELQKAEGVPVEGMKYHIIFVEGAGKRIVVMVGWGCEREILGRGEWASCDVS